MPISTDSEEWQGGKARDWMAVHIRQFLSRNGETAFTVEELTKALLEDYPDEFPSVLRENRAAAESFLASVLHNQKRRSLVEDRKVEKDTEEPEIYYTISDEGGHFPIAEVVDVIPRQFESLEEKLEDEADERDSLEREALYRINELERELAGLRDQVREQEDGW